MTKPHRPRGDGVFIGVSGALMWSYAILIVLMLAALVAFDTDPARDVGGIFAWFGAVAAGIVRIPGVVLDALGDDAVRHATLLSLLTCSLAAILSVWVAVPTGYLLSRSTVRGRRVVNALVDIPIVLPPLVVGLCLLILFRIGPARMLDDAVAFTYEVAGIVLAQFVVGCAFAIRTMRVVFEQIDDRYENVALTLGCSRGQAFFRVVLPEAVPGIVAAATIAWARALGEFGPILVFVGATRMKTEVLPTTIFLEMSIGNIEAAAAVSILLVIVALVVLGVARLLGARRGLM